MMTIYKWENGGLKETVDFSPSCWINLSEPTTAELEQVLSFSQIPRDFLTDPLDREERPRFVSMCRTPFAAMRMTRRFCRTRRFRWAWCSSGSP